MPTTELLVLQDLLAVEIAEMQSRLDGGELGCDWRLACEHKRRALCMALDFVQAALASKRPGQGGLSAASRDFYAHGKPLPRALVEQGFASAGIHGNGQKAAALIDADDHTSHEAPL